MKQACVVRVNEDDVGLSHVPEQNSMQLVHNAAITHEMKEDAVKGVFPMHIGAHILDFQFQKTGTIELLFVTVKCMKRF